MAISVFDLFSIGIGPSSSHTVGPMRAANQFMQALQDDGLIPQVVRVKTDLFGSLGATGKGHGSDKAVIFGLEGDLPETIDTTSMDPRLDSIRAASRIHLMGEHPIKFCEKTDIIMHRRKALPFHPNGMTFVAFNLAGDELHNATFYSVGGGFIVDETAAGSDRIKEDDTKQPFPFLSAVNLLIHCANNNMRISDVMMENEKAWRSEEDIRSGLLNIWKAMQTCVTNGCLNEGILPGGLNVKRRAADLYHKLTTKPEITERDPLTSLDWVNLYALAVNEENAAGGRVVTAPTNGAAGIIPAVMHYYYNFFPNASEDGIVRFLLTAGAIGILYKENASISGAEVGCQGEVGSACSMAAGALTEVLGGTPEQAENAAEIGMEHNLGLTCDPIGGLVQVPCIERNAMASVKAINAARISMRGDGQHFVSLDKVIKTMRETGADMKTKYKETSRGGLAVNIIEC
ncbi:MAG: L-serine dehydratase [Urechidicola sp.]|jgi:L-serine dehydratase